MGLFHRSTTGSTALSPVASLQGITLKAKKTGKAKDKPADDTVVADDDMDAAANPPPAAANPDNAENEDEDGDDDADGEDDDDEDGDDDSDEADMSKSGSKKAVRAARLRERARISAILGHAHAAGNQALAQQLALSTNLTRGQAVAVLEKTPATSANSGTLAGRMANTANRHVQSAPPKQSREAAIEAGWDRAIKRARDPFSAVAE